MAAIWDSCVDSHVTWVCNNMVPVSEGSAETNLCEALNPVQHLDCTVCNQRRRVDTQALDEEEEVIGYLYNILIDADGIEHEHWYYNPGVPNIRDGVEFDANTLTNGTNGHINGNVNGNIDGNVSSNVSDDSNGNTNGDTNGNTNGINGNH